MTLSEENRLTVWSVELIVSRVRIRKSCIWEGGEMTPAEVRLDYTWNNGDGEVAAYERREHVGMMLHALSIWNQQVVLFVYIYVSKRLT